MTSMSKFVYVFAAAALQLNGGLQSGKASLLALRLDPHCTEGVVNTAMTACCQKDCGECDDRSDICVNNATNGRGTTCCPSIMLADEKFPSCEISKAPCAVPESVRSPASVADLKGSGRNAEEDCGEAVGKTQNVLHVATAYIKFSGKTIGATKDTNTKYGTTEQAAAACSSKDDCMGFDSDGLFTASTRLEPLSDGGSGDLYLKREDQYTGNTYLLEAGTFGACSASCGGGELTHTYGCKSSSGVTVNLGMCSTQAAMNEDAAKGFYDETLACNTHDCAVAAPPCMPVCDYFATAVGNYRKECKLSDPPTCSKSICADDFAPYPVCSQCDSCK